MATNLINALNFDGNNYNITLPYGICENAATANAMTVTVDNATLSLEEGARIAVKFTNTPSAQSNKTPTLNVNGLGAATIKAHGTTLATDYYWAPGQVVELIYADSAWHVLGAPTNTQYSFSASNPTLAWGQEATIGSAGGATFKVTMPANPNSDTKVTSVGNHYTPAADTAEALSADASGATSTASWNSTNLVTGVNLQRDAKGHVTGVTVDSIKMPTNPDTNTAHTHTAGIGLVGSGNSGTNTGAYTYKAALVNETVDALPALYYAGTSNRFYAVQLDKNGKLAVNVPWSNTTYQAAGSSLGLVKSGGDVTISDGVITVTNDSHSHSSSTITGTLTTSQIPSLAASKITSGTFDAARIPNLDASKITSGTIDAARLPSYVDDVLEGHYYASGIGSDTTPVFVLVGAGSTAVTPESGKVYVDISTNKTYRWSGTQYTLIASDLALGETSTTAYRGDLGAAAYAHAVTNKGQAYASGLYKITTNSEGHVTAATAVAKADITALGIPGSDTNTAHAHSAGTGIKLTGSGGTSGTTTVALDTEYYASEARNGLMTAAMVTKLNGIATGANNYSLPLAASGTRGGIKVGYSSTTKNNLPIQLDNEKAYVIITSDAVTTALGFTPTANTGDITGVTAGKGLTGGATSGTATLAVGAGTGIIVGDDTVSLDTNYYATAERNGLMSAGNYTFLLGHGHSASYTPAGSVSQPTFTASNSFTAATSIKTATTTVNANTNTTSVNSLTSGGSLTGTCANKCLTLTFTAATSSSVSVPTSGHTHTATTSVTVNTTKYTPTGTVSKPTFTGTAATIETGAGSVAAE